MKRLMTNVELAKWLAKGNGQFIDMREEADEDGHVAGIEYMYQTAFDNVPVSDQIYIREWGGKWHKPYVVLPDPWYKEIKEAFERGELIETRGCYAGDSTPTRWMTWIGNIAPEWDDWEEGSIRIKKPE